MEKENLINELKTIGFNEYKAKVFYILLQGDILSAKDIAEKAGIVRGSIYDILRGFVEKGYCNEIETNRILQYHIIEPDIILDKLIKEYHKNYDEKISSIKDTFKEVKKIYKEPKRSNDENINIELIRGFNKHRMAKHKEFIEKAEKELLATYKFKGIVTDEADEVLGKLITRGVKVRSIYQAGLDFKIKKGQKIIDGTNEDLIKLCGQFRNRGEDVRITEKDMPNITIADSENLFVNINDKWIPRQSQADIIFNRSSFAIYMKDLFEYYWDNSFTVEEYKKKSECT